MELNVPKLKSSDKHLHFTREDLFSHYNSSQCAHWNCRSSVQSGAVFVINHPGCSCLGRNQCQNRGLNVPKDCY